MATVLFNPFYFSIDGNGVPRAGATLSFFQTGASTPQNTFTDSTLVTPNANPVVADSNGLFPPIYLSASFDYKVILKDAAANTIATRDPIGYVPAGGTLTVPPPSYLNGLAIQNAGGVSTFTVAVGSAADSTNASLMKLSATLQKTTTAWVVGNGSGGLDTGAIAASTWYHVYLIQRTDTAVVDVLFSLSATTPTLPANYTLFRRIRAQLTDGSKHWIADVQDGDTVSWATPVTSDVFASNPGTSAVTATLPSVPTGVRVAALILGMHQNLDANLSGVYFSDLSTADITPTASFLDVALVATAGGATGTGGVRVPVFTNTSAQIRYRTSYSSANTSVRIDTLGWIDRRGRDA